MGHGVNRKELQGAVKNGTLLPGSRNKKLYWAKKVDCYGKVTFLYGMTGVNQVDDLTSADKVIPE